MPSVSEIIDRIRSRGDAPVDANLANLLRAYAESIDNIVIGRRILEESGARRICDAIVAEKHWAIRTNSMVKGAREIGAFLELRGSVGGAAGPTEYYFGEIVLVGASAEDNSVTVYSQEVPHIFHPDKKGKWGSQKTLEKAVRLAMDNPGKFQWMEGMGYEEHIYRNY